MDSREDKRATQFDMLQAQTHFPLSTKGPASNAEQKFLSQEPLKRQQSPAPERGRARKVLKGHPKPLKLPMIVESGGLSPSVQNCDPWDIYKVIFTCDLAGQVTIGENRHHGSKVVAIRTAANANGEDLLEKYSCLHHINIISASECFKNDGLFHFVVDDLPVTLEHLVASDAYPTEVQLASILKQVRFRNMLSKKDTIFTWE